MEYLLKPNDKGRFKIVHRLATRHQRVGVCVYDPENPSYYGKRMTLITLVLGQ